MEPMAWIVAVNFVLHVCIYIFKKIKAKKLKARGICPVCEGGGEIPREHGEFGAAFEATCPTCEGTGEYNPLLFQKYQ